MNSVDRKIELLAERVRGFDESVLETIGKRILQIYNAGKSARFNISSSELLRRDLQSIVKRTASLTKANASDISKIYEEELTKLHAGKAYLYKFRQKNFIPFADNKRLQTIATAFAKETIGTMMNFSSLGGIGFISDGRYMPMNDFYLQTLDRAVFEIANGTEGFYSAMNQTIKEMGGGGVRVLYDNGYSRRLDSTIRQALLYGTKKANEEYQNYIAEELGCDGIEIDWHSDPRPSHEFMQGKQYSTQGDKVINGVLYEDAKSAGVYQALSDYGCRHFETAIICGISEPAIDPKQLAELNETTKTKYNIDGVNKTGYEWEQVMRRMETYTRDLKSEKIAFESAGNAEEVKKIKRKIKALKEKYKKIEEATGKKNNAERMRFIKP